MKQEERPEEQGNRWGKHDKGHAGRTVLIVALIGIALAGCAGGYYYYQKQKEAAELQALLDSDRIFPGVSIEGRSVAGMTRDEAAAFIKEELCGSVDSLALYYEEESWEVPFTQLEVDFGFDRAAEEAYALGRSDNGKASLSTIRELEETGQSIAVDVSYRDEALRTEVAAIAEALNQEPENAELVKKGESFEIEGGAVGRVVNESDLTRQMAQSLEQFDFEPIEVPVETEEPALSKKVFDFEIKNIGSYTTHYASGDSGRNTNLVVGCEYINGTVLMPGEEFSMNDRLGDQTWERGFRNAAVIVDGKLEQGLGGGVCQITTTVYNAVIRAELKVVERHNHSLAVGYVPTGLDAAIAGTYKDLKFVNSTEYPVYLEAYASGGNLVCNLYGYEEHDAGHGVEFERVYAGTIPKPAEKVTEDPERYEDEREVTFKGKDGFKITVYKIVTENGKQVSREWFSDSTYRAVADEVTVGTKPREATETPDTPIGAGGTEPSVPASSGEGENAGASTPAEQPDASTGENTQENTQENNGTGSEETDDQPIGTE